MRKQFNNSSCYSIFSAFLFAVLVLFFISCASQQKNTTSAAETPEAQTPVQNADADDDSPRDTITLLFAGDIMAHSVNYNISSYDKIWRDVKELIKKPDLAFGNIEAPVDTTQSASNYPNFNMTKKYVQAVIDAGFDVFSLANNHTNDQSLKGINETIKTSQTLTIENAEKGHKIYFSGLKTSPESQFSYCIVERHGWKILFLAVTEILNRPDSASHINYIKTSPEAKEAFCKYIADLKASNPCDLFVLSIHANESEYVRTVQDSQEEFYKALLENGVDVVWANHAHIIKNRKIIVDTKTGREKLIMYANGNTISGQRTKPELTSKNPVGERDNTGDGLLYQVEFKKGCDNNQSTLKILRAKPFFITTYINTAYEYVLKPLNQDFIDYLNEVQRLNWAKYIERRIKINKDATKDIIEWQ